MTIMNIGKEFVTIAKNNSISISDETREIIDKFGNILLDMGANVEDFRIHLNNLKPWQK
ncbi:MAG: hypothetical protein ACXWFZ_13875 [Nitrososphaeraceae archaeon]